MFVSLTRWNVRRKEKKPRSAKKSNSVENTRFCEMKKRSFGRTSFYAKRDTTRINLLHSFYRWRTLQYELQLSYETSNCQGRRLEPLFGIQRDEIFAFEDKY